METRGFEDFGLNWDEIYEIRLEEYADDWRQVYTRSN